MKYKILTEKQKELVVAQVKSLIYAYRDKLWSLKRIQDPKTRPLIDINDCYVAEAFGIMRGLAITSYGYFGLSNLDGCDNLEKGAVREHNLKWWFDQIEKSIREELDLLGWENDEKRESQERELYKRYNMISSVLGSKVMF